MNSPFVFSSCHAHTDADSMAKLVPNGAWRCPLCNSEGFNVDGKADAILKPTKRVHDYYLSGRRLHGRTPLALGWTNDKQSVRYHALTKGIANYARVLDYGCGHGDLLQYLNVHRIGIDYTGVDLWPEVINENKMAHGTASAHFRHINSASECRLTTDHVVLCGVFNLNSGPHHFEHIKATIAHLFTITKVALHVDFLTENVDHQKETDWHQHRGEMLGFLSTLSRRHSVQCDYLPYEYCVHLWKDQEIDRPRNVYVRGISG